jgi:hypothetical protein
MTARQAAGLELGGLKPPRLGEKVTDAAPIAFGHTSDAIPIGRIVEVKEEDGGLTVTSEIFGHSADFFIIDDLFVQEYSAPLVSTAAPHPCPSKRRIGTFSITRELIDIQDPTVMVALDGCVVVRCELDYASGRFEYTALHADFDERPYGDPPIAYVPVIHVEHPNGITGGKTYRRT